MKHFINIGLIVACVECNGLGCKEQERGGADVTSSAVALADSSEAIEASTSYDEASTSTDGFESYDEDLPRPEFPSHYPDISYLPDISDFDPRQCFSYVTPDACNIPLPEPDTPCDNEGQIRCTNVGLIPLLKVLDSATCLRPNYVRCERAEGGELLWKLHPVEQKYETYGDNFQERKFQGTYCQENERGVAFCPWMIRFEGVRNDPYIGELFMTLCDPFAWRKQFCDTGAIRSCLFADEVQSERIRKAWVEPFLEKYPELGNCLFYWITEVCEYVRDCERAPDRGKRFVGGCAWGPDCTVGCDPSWVSCRPL